MQADEASRKCERRSRDLWAIGSLCQWASIVIVTGMENHEFQVDDGLNDISDHIPELTSTNITVYHLSSQAGPVAR